MSLNVLLLMNEKDSAAIETLLMSKIPGYDVSFCVSENFVCSIARNSSGSHSSEIIDYSLYDVCIVKGTRIANRLKSIDVSAICWDKMEDLSVKFDVFLQLHRHLKKFPLDLQDWRLTEVLHNSQDCIIYKGLDANTTSVAIKRFKFKSNQLSQKSVRDYLNGISLQCGVRSNGLVDFYEGGISNNAFYLVMEYLPLGNLRRYLDARDSVLPLRHAFEWFEEIASALAAVHQAGLIHRDLKIDNIMLRGDGSLALTDYGVSKNILLSAGFLTEDEFHGSPYYVSPELIAGESCSQSSDIYSLGIIFYELLVGARPYNANNPHHLMMAHISESIPTFPSHLELFQPFLEKMMAKSSKDRFVNMIELLKSFNLARDALKQLNGVESTPPHFFGVS